jgi:hypothetical protein
MKSTILPNSRPSTASQFVQILREGAFPALRLLARPSTLAQIPRLLREGLGPAQRMFIQAHNNREMARLVREQGPVTIRLLLCPLRQHMDVLPSLRCPVAKPGRSRQQPSCH